MFTIRATRRVLTALYWNMCSSIGSGAGEEQEHEGRTVTQEPLSPKARRVLGYLRRTQIERRLPATRRRMALDLGMSTTNAHWWVVELERLGYLERVSGQDRGIRIKQGDPVPIFEAPDEIASDTELWSDRHLVEYLPQIVASEWAPEAEVFLRIGAGGLETPGYRPGDVVGIRCSEPAKGRMGVFRIDGRIVFRVLVEQTPDRVAIATLDKKGGPEKTEEFLRSEHRISIEGSVVHMLANLDVSQLDYLEDNEG